MRAPRPFRHVHGFSVTEAAIMLTAFSIFAAAAAPTVNDYAEQARFVRALHDVRTLSVVLTRLFDDVWPERHVEEGWASHVLLVGSGAPPRTRGAGTVMWAADVRSDSVDLLDDHLVANAPGYTPRGRDPMFGWRGAYLQDRVHPDPWGHRYAVNTGAMVGHDTHAVVISPGPDGVVETPFNVQRLPARGDDIAAVLAPAGSAHSPRTGVTFQP